MTLNAYGKRSGSFANFTALRSGARHGGLRHDAELGLVEQMRSPAFRLLAAGSPVTETYTFWSSSDRMVFSAGASGSSETGVSR